MYGRVGGWPYKVGFSLLLEGGRAVPRQVFILDKGSWARPAGISPSGLEPRVSRDPRFGIVARSRCVSTSIHSFSQSCGFPPPGAMRGMNEELLLPGGVVEVEPTGDECEEGKRVLLKLVWVPLTSTLRVHDSFGRGAGWRVGTWRQMVEPCVRDKHTELTVQTSCYS